MSGTAVESTASTTTETANPHPRASRKQCWFGAKCRRTNCVFLHPVVSKEVVDGNNDHGRGGGGIGNGDTLQVSNDGTWPSDPSVVRDDDSRESNGKKENKVNRSRRNNRSHGKRSFHGSKTGGGSGSGKKPFQPKRGSQNASDASPESENHLPPSPPPTAAIKPTPLSNVDAAGRSSSHEQHLPRKNRDGKTPQQQQQQQHPGRSKTDQKKPKGRKVPEKSEGIVDPPEVERDGRKRDGDNSSHHSKTTTSATDPAKTTESSSTAPQPPPDESVRLKPIPTKKQQETKKGDAIVGTGSKSKGRQNKADAHHDGCVGDDDNDDTNNNKGQNGNKASAASKNGRVKACRYGAKCRNKQRCKFLHPGDSHDRARPPKLIPTGGGGGGEQHENNPCTPTPPPQDEGLAANNHDDALNMVWAADLEERLVVEAAVAACRAGARPPESPPEGTVGAPLPTKKQRKRQQNKKRRQEGAERRKREEEEEKRRRQQEEEWDEQLSQEVHESEHQKRVEEEEVEEREKQAETQRLRQEKDKLKRVVQMEKEKREREGQEEAARDRRRLEKEERLREEDAKAEQQRRIEAEEVKRRRIHEEVQQQQLVEEEQRRAEEEQQQQAQLLQSQPELASDDKDDDDHDDHDDHDHEAAGQGESEEDKQSLLSEEERERYKAERKAAKKERRRLEKEAKAAVAKKQGAVTPAEKGLNRFAVAVATPLSDQENDDNEPDGPASPAAATDDPEERQEEEEEERKRRWQEELRLQKERAAQKKQDKRKNRHEKFLQDQERAAEERSKFWAGEISKERRTVELLALLCAAEFCRKFPSVDTDREALVADCEAGERLRDACHEAYSALYKSEAHRRVVVKGMKQQELNDRQGTIERWEESKGKFYVGLDTKKGKNAQLVYFLPGNLKALPIEVNRKNSKNHDPVHAVGIALLYANHSLDFQIRKSLVDRLLGASSAGKLLDDLMEERTKKEYLDRLLREEEQRREAEERARRAEQRRRENEEWEKQKKEYAERKKEYAEWRRQERRDNRRRSSSHHHPYCDCPECRLRHLFGATFGAGCPGGVGAGFGGRSAFGGRGSCSPFGVFFGGPEMFFEFNFEDDDDDDYDHYQESWDRRWEELHEENMEEKNREAAELLGVDVDADEAVIKREYRKKALKFHPDKYRAANHEDGMTKDEAEEHFKHLTNAYDHLMSNFDEDDD